VKNAHGCVADDSETNPWKRGREERGEKHKERGQMNDM